MRSTTRASIYLPMAAMIMTAIIAVPVAAQQQIPFKGIFQGQDSHDILAPGDTAVVIRTTAKGTGTHLGQFQLTREITGNLVNFTDTGTAQWAAPNGDSIDTTVAGQAELSEAPAGYLKVTEIHTVIGGTGRFTGAQGSFIVELWHKLEPSEVADGVQTHDIFGAFHGAISSPGKAH